MGELRFDGRVAIVTGAGRGIGRDHAVLLASRGAAVLVNDLGGEKDGVGGSPQPADDVVTEICADGGTAVANHDSVASEEGAASIVRAAVAVFGQVDVVVNNAGIAIPGPFVEEAYADFRRVLDVHVSGTYLVSKAAWPHLVQSTAGRIVNTTSQSVLGYRNYAGYAAAKGAIIGLTRTLAVEGAEHRILANCLAPGAFTRIAMDEGAIVPELREQAERDFSARYPAMVAAYLAHESCALNGDIIQAAAGRISRLFIAETDGIVDRGCSVETVRDRLGDIRTEAGCHVWADAAEQAEYAMAQVAAADA